MADILVYDNDGNIKEEWSNNLVKAEEVNFNGWLCGIGLESIEIRNNGDIYRGICRVGGPIAHIDDDEWNLPRDFIICDKTACTCVADLKSTRYKNADIRNKLKEIVKTKVKEYGGQNSNNF